MGPVLLTLGHVAVTVLVIGAASVWLKRLAPDRAVLWIIASGVAARAVPGLVLFEISNARLPVARSFQLEPGFWFFAPDASGYYRAAASAAARGLAAIATIDPQAASVFYLKTLALGLYAFGSTPATSVLVNVLAFLALAAAMVQWHRRSGADRASLVFALAAVSFAPSWLVWSFQPLKDTLFLTLIGVFFSFADGWYTRLTASRVSWTVATAWLLAVAAMVYALAGIRWYYAVVIVLAVPIGLLAALAGRRPLLSWRAAFAALGLALLVQSLVLGAGPYLPPWVRVVLRPQGAQTLRAVSRAPALAAGSLEETHNQNVKAEGATQIQPVKPIGESPTWTALVRLQGNLAALTLPRRLAFAVGRITIGGGRGLWAFADLDTVFFELTLLGCGWLIARARWRGAVIRPVFWHLAIATAVITALLGAEAANFGTLFRMRAMIAVGIALLPLAVGSRRTEAAGSRSPARASSAGRF